ncbi:DUF3017 domain-containing protein [Tessaracoccus flavus]|uniref:Uncharacterized protein n=1 Tax=Tessaracoccus flavus TaxID=1610493 RepID=A0A1Q2CG06_9ACTN|nr:DUF3017 domain-containing protein [Tessaracoccus flavus]AQP45049.1 hypothetical protein RPIT_09835 [Tessaracoccus flavus]SDY58043.1 Protein of unknown function [Tessaracoccus flavus]
MPDKPADSYPDNPWPLLLVLAAVLVGVGYAGFGHWRRAALMIAGALALGAGLRAVLPPRLAGLLVVRRRWIDVAVMATFGVAIAVVSLVVPPSR